MCPMSLGGVRSPTIVTGTCIGRHPYDGPMDQHRRALQTCVAEGEPSAVANRCGSSRERGQQLPTHLASEYSTPCEALAVECLRATQARQRFSLQPTSERTRASYNHRK